MIVVGAGVIGVAAAYALVRRGLSVTLIDGAAEPGRGTSFANGGQLAYTYTDALGSPGLLKKLPFLLLAADASFRLRLSADPAFLRWGLAFLRNCSGERFRANTLAGLRLGLESRLAMHTLLDRHALDFGHAGPGKLYVYDDAESFASAQDLLKMKRSAGASAEAISHAEAMRIEPALHAATGPIVGAIHSPQEELGDPFRFCSALAALLQERYGVRGRFGSEVARLDIASSPPAVILATGERIEAREILLCTGVATPRLLRGTGIAAPIWPMKGYSFTASPGTEAPRLSITHVGRKLVFCPLSGKMRVAGLADLGFGDPRIDPKRSATLLASAWRTLPHAVDYENVECSWAGLRPMTPSSLPIIGRVARGLVLNVGHGILGWTYAMGSAERAAMLVAGSAGGRLPG